MSILRNLRAGRMQKTLAAATAVSAPAMAFETYLEHYKASFGDRWMWTPVVLTPPLTAAGIAAIFSERAARTVLPAISAVYFADGHIRAIPCKTPPAPEYRQRRQLSNPHQSLRFYGCAGHQKHLQSCLNRFES